jgi:hypothetical protein
MELVLVVTFSGLVGLLVRYLVPGRATHGLFVIPSVGIVAGSLSWAIGIWAGLAPTSIWPWILSLGISVAASMALAIVLPGKRSAADDALWHELTGSRTPTQ